MSISKVAQFVTPPENIGDYDAQNAHIAGFTRQLAGPSMALTEWENSTTIPKLALGTYLSHGGYLYRVDTEDYVISGTPTDGTWYIRLEASGDTLIATWISDVSGYAWDAVNNGLYNGSYQVLPYQLVKAGAVLTKRKIMNLWQGSGFQTVDREGGVSVAGLTSPTFNGFQSYKLPGSSMSTLFAGPSTKPTGLAYDSINGNLISCDADSDLIYIYDGITDTISSSFASPSTYPSGLTFDGTNLISCDADSDRIYIHDGISSTILSSFASPSIAPYGLTFDGTNLISCDIGSNLIYVHSGVTSTILSIFASPDPHGLTFDGTNLISCDTDSDLIYIHNSKLEFIG